MACTAILTVNSKVNSLYQYLQILERRFHGQKGMTAQDETTSERIKDGRKQRI